MLEKVDLDKIIFEPEEEEQNIDPNSRRVKRDIMKELTIQGYTELIDMYGNLVYYIEKKRDLLLKGCVGLKNAQQEIQNEYNELLKYCENDFKFLEKLLVERQKMINEKGE